MKSCPHHAVFQPFFFLDYRKKYATTTNSHIKCLIELLKERNLLTSSLSTIWGDTDGCEEQYLCISELYLMSVMS